MKKERYDVSGMSCSACSSRVQKVVSELAGVAEVQVNLLKNSMIVVYDEQVVSSESIISAVKGAGYGAALPHGKGASPTVPQDEIGEEIRRMKVRLALSCVFTVLLVLVSLAGGWGLNSGHPLIGALTQLLLLIPVIGLNAKYYRNGVKSMLKGAPNMDTLVALGSGAAAISGIYGIYQMAWTLESGPVDLQTMEWGHLYFESAAMILTLITVGKFLEARARGKTTSAIEGLMRLAPQTATVLRDGNEVSVSIDEVAVGDLVVVKAGEHVPVDGVIVEGYGMLDESALTGESVPRDKTVGDQTTGASVNMSGRFVMKALRVGEQTTLAQIIQLVDDASSSKAPIARLADRISGIFVPVVLGIALATFFIWIMLGKDVDFALSAAIAVLVISCPCALGLATPTAIMVGMGRGASHGLLFKSAEAIETTGWVDMVVLDKTGTVTEGHPAVTDIVKVSSVSRDDEILRLAGSLEKLSEHPLGHAIVQEMENRALPSAPVTDFQQIPGQGIVGSVNGSVCAVGNALMLRERGIVNALQVVGDRLAAEGKTPLYCVQGHSLVGMIALADTIKPSSRRAVAELMGMGLEVMMLTGDCAATAEAIRRQAGIQQVVSDVLPSDKDAVVRKLQEQGKQVAMVGDGINDAPALARAHVGIAIGAGTDIAIDSADIVLMKNDLLDVAAAIQLSRAVMRNIKQNLFWAFFYNCIGIPVAAGVFYGLWGVMLNPMIAAAAMSFSSVSVVTNALRLRKFSPKYQTEPPQQSSVSSGSNVSICSVASAQPPTGRVRTIGIEGMHCNHCSSKVEQALRALPGVHHVSVDLAAKLATVVSSPDVSDEQLKVAVTEAGFQVVEIQPQASVSSGSNVSTCSVASEQPPTGRVRTIGIDGMHCNHCSSKVEQALRALPGVHRVSVDLAAKQATVMASQEVLDEQLKKTVTEAGFQVVDIQ